MKQVKNRVQRRKEAIQELRNKADPAKLRTVAVILGDNDFGHTFVPLLESVGQAIAHFEGFSPKVIETLIREGIRYHYLAFQLGNRWEESNSRINSLVDGLKKVKVLFGLEAENDILNADHDSGAWYLEIQTGKVFPY